MTSDPASSWKITPLLTVLVMISLCRGYGYFDSQYGGSYTRGVSVTSLALGGLRAVNIDDPSAVMLNPALLGRLEECQLSMGVGPTIWVESADNPRRLSRSGLSFSPAFLFGGCKMGTVSLAAGLSRVSDSEYFAQEAYYGEEIGPDSFSVILSEAEASGGLWECVIGGSWSLTPGFALGLSGGMRFGSGSFETRIDSLHTSVLDSVVHVDWEETSPCLHAGAALSDSLMGCGLSLVTGSDRYRALLAVGAFTTLSYLNNGTFGFEVEAVDPLDLEDLVVRMFADVPMGRSISTKWGISFDDSGSSYRAGFGFSLGMAVTTGRTSFEGGFCHWSRSREGGTFPYIDQAMHHETSANVLGFGATIRI